MQDAWETGTCSECCTRSEAENMSRYSIISALVLFLLLLCVDIYLLRVLIVIPAELMSIKLLGISVAAALFFVLIFASYIVYRENAMMYFFLDRFGSIHAHKRDPRSSGLFGTSSWHSFGGDAGNKPNFINGAIIVLDIVSSRHRVLENPRQQNGWSISSGNVKKGIAISHGQNSLGLLSIKSALKIINCYPSISSYLYTMSRAAVARDDLGVLILAAIAYLKGSKSRLPSTAASKGRCLLEQGLKACALDNMSVRLASWRASVDSRLAILTDEVEEMGEAHREPATL